jgi:hypothetical protein
MHIFYMYVARYCVLRHFSSFLLRNSGIFLLEKVSYKNLKLGREMSTQFESKTWREDITLETYTSLWRLRHRIWVYGLDLPRTGQRTLTGLLARLKIFEKRLLASSCVSIFPSVRLHGTTQLLPWNFILEYFSEKWRENWSFIKSDKNNGYFIWKFVYIYDNISFSYSYSEKCFRQKL